MTEAELKMLDRVRPEDAAAFLRGAVFISPQALRCWAQSGKCPFCHAIKMSPLSHRHVYIVNTSALIKFREGVIT